MANSNDDDDVAVGFGVGTLLGIAIASVPSNLARRRRRYGLPPAQQQGPGLIGPPGARGERGPMGLSGAKGDVGRTGDAGSPGPKGDKGDAGLTGAKGDKGDAGLPGPKGDMGDMGDQGDTGLTGPKGDKGDTGLTGAKGDTGDPGPAGPATQEIQLCASAANPLIPQGMFGVDGDVQTQFFRVAADICRFAGTLSDWWLEGQSGPLTLTITILKAPKFGGFPSATPVTLTVPTGQNWISSSATLPVQAGDRITAISDGAWNHGGLTLRARLT